MALVSPIRDHIAATLMRAARAIASTKPAPSGAGVSQLWSNIMSTIADIKAAADALAASQLAAAAREKTLIQTMVTAAAVLQTQITNLQAQLAAATPDPTAIAAIITELQTTQAALDAQDQPATTTTTTNPPTPAPSGETPVPV